MASTWTYCHTGKAMSLYTVQENCENRIKALFILNVNDWYGASAPTLVSYLINWGGNPFLDGLAWFTKKSKSFNHNDIASYITTLTLTFNVNGPHTTFSRSELNVVWRTVTWPGFSCFPSSPSCIHKCVLIYNYFPWDILWEFFS